MPQVAVEQAARFYGITLPTLQQVGNEIRTRCFLNCGKTAETGDRALAIRGDDPFKQWHCHQAGCGKNGNLISLCDLIKPGQNAAGRPRGERFKQIAADLVGMVAGTVSGATLEKQSAPIPAAEPPKTNFPLKDSPNERARTLTDLDRKFVVDVAAMPPKASSYFRQRSFLSPDVCRAWRMGYLPRDTGEDKSGGTMRGKIVYPYFSPDGEILTWFGRDPEYEDKHRQWETSDRSEKEPEKFHFVKRFQRGLELFGQDRLREEANREQLQHLGLLLVEGPNDVIRLSSLGVPAVALCASTITREQAEKAARLAREYAQGIVTVFLDCDEEGEKGMKQCLGYIAQLAPVRLAWTSKMHSGKFQGRQPESLSLADWEEIAVHIKR